MLLLVGRRFGPALTPALRTDPNDSVARALQWEHDLETGVAEAPAETHDAGRRRAGRFRRDEGHAPAVPPHTVQH